MGCSLQKPRAPPKKKDVYTVNVESSRVATPGSGTIVAFPPSAGPRASPPEPGVPLVLIPSLPTISTSPTPSISTESEWATKVEKVDTAKEKKSEVDITAVKEDGTEVSDMETLSSSTGAHDLHANSHSRFPPLGARAPLPRTYGEEQQARAGAAGLRPVGGARGGSDPPSLTSSDSSATSHTLAPPKKLLPPPIAPTSPSPTLEEITLPPTAAVPRDALWGGQLSPRPHEDSARGPPEAAAAPDDPLLSRLPEVQGGKGTWRSVDGRENTAEDKASADASIAGTSMLYDQDRDIHTPSKQKARTGGLSASRLSSGVEDIPADYDYAPVIEHLPAIGTRSRLPVQLHAGSSTITPPSGARRNRQRDRDRDSVDEMSFPDSASPPSKGRKRSARKHAEIDGNETDLDEGKRSRGRSGEKEKRSRVESGRAKNKKGRRSSERSGGPSQAEKLPGAPDVPSRREGESRRERERRRDEDSEKLMQRRARHAKTMGLE